VIVTVAFRKPVSGLSRKSLLVYFFLVTISHSILDALVDGTLGVALLAPFSENRFFLPWRPIRSSPIGLEFFSPAGAITLMNELLWVWAPSLVVILGPRLRKLLPGRTASSSTANRVDRSTQPLSTD
jgi:inner membrane protein